MGCRRRTCLHGRTTHLQAAPTWVSSRGPRSWLPDTTTTTSPAWCGPGSGAGSAPGPSSQHPRGSSLDEVDRHRVRSRAVLRKARSEGVLSHVSALAEYGAPFWDLPLDDVHLTRFDQRAGRREAGVCQHRGRLLVGDVTLPQRGDGDVSGAHRARHHGEHGHRARRGGRLQHAEGRAVHACPSSNHAYVAIEPRAHSLGTRVVLGLVDPRFESVGEARTAFHCWAQGLPRPRAPVRDPRDGQARARSSTLPGRSIVCGSSSTGGASTSTI